MATHWSNFNATATFGMVHLVILFINTFIKYSQGNHEDAKVILEPYFFKPGSNVSKQGNGGSLLALGMTHAATNNKEILNFLVESFKNPAINSNESIIHGACLGIGMTAMSS